MLRLPHALSGDPAGEFNRVRDFPGDGAEGVRARPTQGRASVGGSWLSTIRDPWLSKITGGGELAVHDPGELAVHDPAGVPAHPDDPWPCSSLRAAAPQGIDGLVGGGR